MLKAIWRRLTGRQESHVEQSSAVAQMVATHLTMNVEMLHFDVRQVEPSAAMPLLGYVYGACKGVAIAAEFKEPEVYYLATLRVLREVFPRDVGRLEAVLRESWDGIFEQKQFKIGLEPGLSVGISLIVEQQPKLRDLSALLFKHYRHGIGNKDILARMEVSEQNTASLAGELGRPT
ncbi:hypothetical protein [Ralstonia pseudosolanacearum]|uniref:hypothetical protein n=1 Tax=Ralstonia pseudosolanacearum TaxID=1310165 RepID=UPI0018D0B0DF|nr:hypothetical protein [Ralstonia pseudosolanacearum]